MDLLLIHSHLLYPVCKLLLMPASVCAGAADNSHSHTVKTCQPADWSSAFFNLSRFTVPENFCNQNSCRDLGVYAYLHPSCRCQKQPCTKMTVLYFGSTMSGLPARVLLWVLNRKPARCNRERNAISGLVSFPLIRDMFQLRFSGVRVSIWHTPERPATGASFYADIVHP